jgi:arsenate reductase (thioredoxin)
MQTQYNVLALCTGNSARSIMAEAILNQKGRLTLPPTARAAILPEQFAPKRCANWKRLTCLRLDFAARTGMNSRSPGPPRLDFVFTVCDNAANEVCPVSPGQPMTAHWGIPDPAAVQGTPEQVEKAFRDAFILLERRISLFLSLPLPTLDRLSLQKEIDKIGRR